MYKKITFLYFTVVICIAFITFTSLYINDPLQVFHKDYQNKSKLLDNMRYQAAGLINNFKYDSLILGTSMLANTSTQEAHQFLGGNFINISIFGGDFYERSLLLNHALKTKSIKQVIYSMDDTYLNLTQASSSQYAYLYDEDFLNDFKIYLNKKYLLKCFLGFSKKEECTGKGKDIYRPSAWYQEARYKRHFGGLTNLLRNQENERANEIYKNIASIASKIQQGKKQPLVNIKEKQTDAYNYIDKYLLSIVKKYPNTQFILVFPPYSRLVYSQWAQYNLSYYKTHQSVLRYLAKKSDKYHNLEVYAWADNDFLDDIANYKDPNHYSHDINTWMLNAIKDKNGQLNSSNIDAYIKRIDTKNLNYDLISIGQKINDYFILKEKNKE